MLAVGRAGAGAAGDGCGSERAGRWEGRAGEAAAFEDAQAPRLRVTAEAAGGGVTRFERVRKN